MQGLELLFHGTKQSFRSKNDVLVSAIHCFLINNDCQCVGVGDEWKDLESGSEMLPEHWNDNQDLYTLRYQTTSARGRYFLKIIQAGSVLLINLLNVDKGKVGATSIKADTYVSDSFQDFKTAFNKLHELQKQLKEELLLNVGFKEERQARSSRERDVPTAEDTDPLRVPGSYRPPRSELPDWYSDPRDPFNVGRSDLDPIGRGLGGGMIFDPWRTGGIQRQPDPGIGGPRLPRGAVPPGARFDPFGPPNPDPSIYRGPNPDHLPPPGSDDMFG